jgi:hypothetical protein
MSGTLAHLMFCTYTCRRMREIINNAVKLIAKKSINLSLLRLEVVPTLL